MTGVNTLRTTRPLWRFYQHENPTLKAGAH